MSGYETIVYENLENKILRLTLNRPEKLNALSAKLLQEFEDALSESRICPIAWWKLSRLV